MKQFLPVKIRGKQTENAANRNVFANFRHETNSVRKMDVFSRPEKERALHGLKIQGINFDG